MPGSRPEDQPDPHPDSISEDAGLHPGRLEPDDTTPPAPRDRHSPMEDPGAPGGTAGTGGTNRTQDD